MNNMSDLKSFLTSAFVVFLIIFAAIGVVTTVIPEYIPESAIASAYEACENNGGLSSIEYDPLSIDVHCINGAKFVVMIGDY
jgi:hypothetical protein